MRELTRSGRRFTKGMKRPGNGWQRHSNTAEGRRVNDWADEGYNMAKLGNAVN
jgi:hypothetical protein